MREHHLTCPDCGAPMELAPSRFGAKNRPYYRCSHWPECKGAHGANLDGSPLGVPASRPTKVLRITAHSIFDQLWKGEGAPMTRSQAYAWMQRVLKMTPDEAHIGKFDGPTCARLIRAVWAATGGTDAKQ